MTGLGEHMGDEIIKPDYGGFLFHGELESLSKYGEEEIVIVPSFSLIPECKKNFRPTRQCVLLLFQKMDK